MTSNTYRAVVFSSDLNFLSLLATPLKDAGVSVSVTSSPVAVLQLIEQMCPDVVVYDADGADENLLYDIDRLLTRTLAHVVRIYTDSPPKHPTLVPDERIHLVRKPIRLDEYQQTVLAFMGPQVDEPDGEDAVGDESKSQEYCGLVCTTPEMRSVWEEVSKAAKAVYPVVIRGECGTEVEDVARAIHMRKYGHEESFHIIYCASLPDYSQEEILFGNARRTKTRSVVSATVYLHNLHEMPMALQGRLVGQLKSNRLRQSEDPQSLWPRFIASFDTPPQQCVAKGLLRSDVYHMVNAISITIPPLRKRTGEILPLIRDRLRRVTGAKSSLPEIDGNALQVLLDYQWPGNTLELENLVARIVTQVSTNVLKVEDLPSEMVAPAKHIPKEVDDGIEDSFRNNPVPLHVFRVRSERNYITRAIAAFDGDKESAAKALGISLATLYRRLPDADQIQRDNGKEV